MALRALYTALDRGTGAPNPVEDTDTFSPPVEEARGLSYELVQVILDAMCNMGSPKARLDGSKAKARLRVIAYTGMRHSELKRFRPEDWNREQHSLVIRTGKGGLPRTIPLVTEAEAALTELIRVNAVGDFSNSTVRRAFVRACAKVKVDGIRPYDLRHTFGTWLYAAAGDLRIVAEMLGHRRTRTTERYTLGYVPDYMRVVSQRFQALLDPAAPAADKPRLTLVQPAPARRQRTA
jgi:integrase